MDQWDLEALRESVGTLDRKEILVIWAHRGFREIQDQSGLKGIEDHLDLKAIQDQ